MARSAAAAEKGTLIGKIFGTLFFAFFLAISLGMIGVGVWQWIEANETYSWEKSTCKIVEASITRPKHRERFEFKVSYSYDFRGKDYTGDQYRGNKETNHDYTPLQRLLLEYKPDSQNTCFVNPANPKQAILAHPSRSSLWFLLFCLPFSAIGLGGIYFLWRGAPASNLEQGRSYSSIREWAGGSRLAKNGGLLFFGIFAMAGTAMFYFLGLVPAMKYLGARDAVATPCQIESSQVRVSSSDNGDSYHIDILYRYQFGGQQYKSNYYDLAGGATFRTSHSSRKIVNQHPAGMQTTCYVDPNDPVLAYLNHDFPHGIWLGMLFSLPFLVVGYGFGVFLLYGQRATARDSATGALYSSAGHALTNLLPKYRGAGRSLTLRPESGRLTNVLGTLFITLFWNGITSVFVWHAVQSHLEGNPEWFLTVFIIPFVIIGLILVGFLLMTCLQLLNPRVTLQASGDAVPLGGTWFVAWKVSGRSEKVKHFRLTLRGREQSTYRRGTDTVTDEHTFAEIPVFSSDDPHEFGRNKREFVIPTDTMHSFQADNNKVIWTLHVAGEIASFPDIDENYQVVLLPHEPTTP